jgi:hypothetical protein
MTTLLYKDGAQHRIETNHVAVSLANGYSVTPFATPTEVDADIDPELGAETDLEAARELYEEKFHKKPHHKKTFATIMNELDEAHD